MIVFYHGTAKNARAEKKRTVNFVKTRIVKISCIGKYLLTNYNDFYIIKISNGMNMSKKVAKALSGGDGRRFTWKSR